MCAWNFLGDYSCSVPPTKCCASALLGLQNAARAANHSFLGVRVVNCLCCLQLLKNGMQKCLCGVLCGRFTEIMTQFLSYL